MRFNEWVDEYFKGNVKQAARVLEMHYMRVFRIHRGQVEPTLMEMSHIYDVSGGAVTMHDFLMDVKERSGHA